MLYALGTIAIGCSRALSPALSIDVQLKTKAILHDLPSKKP